jgi:hypothetical protein
MTTMSVPTAPDRRAGARPRICRRRDQRQRGLRVAQPDRAYLARPEAHRRGDHPAGHDRAAVQVNLPRRHQGHREHLHRLPAALGPKGDDRHRHPARHAGLAATWSPACSLGSGWPSATWKPRRPPRSPRWCCWSSPPTAFVPAQTMPSWLETYVRHQPLPTVLAPARGLVLGGPVASVRPEAALWVADLMLVFMPLATRRPRKALA